MFSDRPIFEFRGPLGVPVQIGASLIVLALIFVNFSNGPEVLTYSLIYFGLVVLSIFLHEMGHAWGAWVQGIPVRRVMIYGGGGFCEHAPSSRYADELIVAMGPLTNLAIWAVASLAAREVSDPTMNWLLTSLAQMNLVLTILNMVPVFPLDGGRLFNLLLNRFLHPELATRISGGLGLLMALAWIPLMLLSFFLIGFLLLFFPPILLHWRMLKGEVIA